MPLATSERSAPWLASGGKTRATISGEANDSPATPSALSVAAPAMPETCVPWPSVGTPSVQTELRQVALWLETRPARSGWVASTPVSTIPIGTDGLGAKVPGKSDQPPSAEMAGSAHWSPYQVSLGALRSAR